MTASLIRHHYLTRRDPSGMLSTTYDDHSSLPTIADTVTAEMVISALIVIH
jgi:hypothetical protein